MKKLTINIFLILTAFILYFFLLFFFNWFTISGVMPNLFVIYILFIGLFSNRITGVIYGVIIGAILDLTIGTQIGINAAGLGVIGFLSATFDKNFSKDSRITIMVMVLASTIIFEVIRYFLNYVLLSNSVEIMNFVKILVIEVIYNLILTIIIYPLIQKFGYIIEKTEGN